ncbi:MAG: hypothetical protein DRJ45_09575 [Thermoprotei archaeon]|nr:MAG: hypothetical protein DRJ45_09575 [Thermoprotei archaeon]
MRGLKPAEKSKARGEGEVRRGNGEGKPLIIYGDGEAIRDFVYVGDVTEAFLRTLGEKASRSRW